MKPSGKPYKQKCPNSIRVYLSECEIDPTAEIDDVELRLTPAGIIDVEEYPIYPLQVIERNADGTGRIRMRVPVTDALQREIQGHGKEVYVVKPVWLREAIVENFRKMVVMYAKEFDSPPPPEAKTKPKPKKKTKGGDAAAGTDV